MPYDSAQVVSGQILCFETLYMNANALTGTMIATLILKQTRGCDAISNESNLKNYDKFLTTLKKSTEKHQFYI